MTSPFARGGWEASRGRSALIADGRSWSFAELDASMGSFVAALLGSGVRRGDRVALRGSNRAETAVALLGMAAAGVTSVLVHPRLTGAEANELVEDAETAASLDDGGVDALLREGGEHPWPILPPPSLGESLAIIYTSGTSGRAKGAVLTHGAFAASAQASGRNLRWALDDRWVAPLPVAHVGGLSVLTRCWIARRPVALLPRYEARAVLDAVRSGGTLVSVVPTMLRGLLEADTGNALAGARAVLVGGAACPPELLTECAARGVRALATYGMTEMCSQVATQAYLPRAVIAQRGVGRPLEGVELRLTDESGAAVATGEVGRIAVRGPMRMAGYWGQAPLAAGKWFDTGDLGSLDADGTLRLHARRTDLIVSGGENVYPVEVEQCLERHPAVAAALVFGVPDDVWGQRVAAAVVARAEVTDEAAWRASVLEYARASLADFKRPRLLARVDAIATLPSGKPDRAGAAARYGAKLRA